MTKQREGVYESLLECAGKEFIEKGYMAASLRTIARKAGTSTGSIYTRFHDKGNLFHALAAGPAEELISRFDDACRKSLSLFTKRQQREAYVYGKEQLLRLVDFVYDHFLEFKLIICCSEGTEYADYLDRLVQLDMKYSAQYANAANSDSLSREKLTPALLHMLSSSFYYGLFEMVIHDMSRQEAKVYAGQLQRFFACGWKDIYEV